MTTAIPDHRETTRRPPGDHQEAVRRPSGGRKKPSDGDKDPPKVCYFDVGSLDELGHCLSNQEISGHRLVFIEASGELALARNGGCLPLSSLEWPKICGKAIDLVCKQEGLFKAPSASKAKRFADHIE